MDELNYAKELDDIVNRMVSEGPHENFDKYWSLYKESAFVPEPEGIYFRISENWTYRNLAIAGDNNIIDIEADETSDVSAISVIPYRAFSEVIFHVGLIPTLPRTKNSLLNVLCRLTGSTSHSPYWCAYNEEEAERLRGFAKVLIRAVSL